ncbi:MAG: hypothetical protein K2P79_12355 [Sphingomonas sp.]|nr:hypothetical protein [Sphingomonas sp.]
MSGLVVVRIIFGIFVAGVAMAYTLPALLLSWGYDIQPYKWPTIFYGGLAFLGMIGMGPIWLIFELLHRADRIKGRQQNG